MQTTIEWINALKQEHEQTWRERPDWYWCIGLLEEVGELVLALAGLHRHSPEYELRQISSIAANWIDKREKDAQNKMIEGEFHERHREPD